MRKNCKCIIAIILTVLCVLNCSSVFGEEKIYGVYRCGGWVISDFGIVECLGVLGDDGVEEGESTIKYEAINITIPKSINGIEVTGISKFALIDANYDKIYIPNTITYIEPITADEIYSPDFTTICFEKGSYADEYFSKNSGFKTEYVDSVKEINASNPRDLKEMEHTKQYNNNFKNSSNEVPFDVKTEFEKKLKEYSTGKYFLFDTDGEGIPELFILNQDDNGNLIKDNKDFTYDTNGKTTTKDFVYYYYNNSDAGKKELTRSSFSSNNSISETFYSIACNGKDRLVMKQKAKLEEREEDAYHVYFKYFNTYVVSKNYHDGKSQYVGIPRSLWEQLMNGNIVIGNISFNYEDEATLTETADKFIAQAEKNPVKIYPTTDMTGLNSWDFSGLKITAEAAGKNVEATDKPSSAGDISVLLNGSAISFTQPPVIENGTTLVPMRAIFEAMGASVDWDGAAQTVTSVKGDTTVSLTLNKTTASVNGKEISLAVPAKLINGSTMVPLRFVSESLGAEVTWDGGSKTVTIKG